MDGDVLDARFTPSQQQVGSRPAGAVITGNKAAAGRGPQRPAAVPVHCCCGNSWQRLACSGCPARRWHALQLLHCMAAGNWRQVTPTCLRPQGSEELADAADSEQAGSGGGSSAESEGKGEEGEAAAGDAGGTTAGTAACAEAAQEDAAAAAAPAAATASEEEDGQGAQDQPSAKKPRLASQPASGPDSGSGTAAAVELSNINQQQAVAAEAPTSASQRQQEQRQQEQQQQGPVHISTAALHGAEGAEPYAGLSLPQLAEEHQRLAAAKARLAQELADLQSAQDAAAARARAAASARADATDERLRMRREASQGLGTDAAGVEQWGRPAATCSHSCWCMRSHACFAYHAPPRRCQRAGR